MAQFDNNEFRPNAQASATGKVKWFNTAKGYGFITLDNGRDAFCHTSALQAVGHSEVPQGTTIVCDLADGQRGLQVVNIHSVDLSTAEAPPRAPKRDFNNDRFSSSFGRSQFRDAAPSGQMVEGKIKFFNDQKGFGFVTPNNGSSDIYLHASALRRSGVQSLEADQRIRYSTRQGNKGVEVDKVEII
jgi:CspA family cold shock protein